MPTERPKLARVRAASPPVASRSGRGWRRPLPQARRFRARSRRTNGRHSCALRAGGCASATSAPAPRRGWNVRCRSPAPAGRRSAAVRKRRRETARPWRASATPCAGDRQRRLPNSPARGRSGSAGWLTPPPRRAHRYRCRAWQARARPRPRPTPPRSRRPGCRRHPPASRAAGRAPARETRSPPGNWSCRRRSAPPAPRHRPAPARSPRDSCGSA